MSHDGDGKRARQKVPECPSGDNHKDKGDKKSSSEANDQGEEEEAVKAPPVAHALAMPSPPPTAVEEMEEMFLRLGFSQAVVLKLMEDQGIVSPWILASLSDENITAIGDMIHRPGGLVGGKTLDRGNQISVLVTKNLKLMAFMFKTMEHCSKDYRIQDINSTSVLHYKHQWELEQKKADNIEAPKVDKNNWAKTMENIVMYLKVVRGMRGTPLA